jgi:hypothetical protein
MLHYSPDNVNDDDIFNCNISRPQFGCKCHSRSGRKSSKADELEDPCQVMTLIIPSKDLEQLQHESNTKQVSLNTRINQIIKDHLNWHTDAPDAKMYYFPRPLITKLVNQLSKKQLSVMTESVVNYFQDTCLLLRGEFSFSSFLDVLKIWLKITRTPNRFEENEYEYKIIIKHDMGYNYSYFTSEVYRYIIQERFHKSFHCKVSENIILIRSVK